LLDDAVSQLKTNTRRLVRRQVNCRILLYIWLEDLTNL
jgi:hypothetical protein